MARPSSSSTNPSARLLEGPAAPAAAASALSRGLAALASAAAALRGCREMEWREGWGRKGCREVLPSLGGPAMGSFFLARRPRSRERRDLKCGEVGRSCAMRPAVCQPTSASGSWTFPSRASTSEMRVKS